MKQSTHLGTLIHFDELRYNRTRYNWMSSLLPHINHMADLYHQLHIGPFDRHAFADLMQNGMANISQKVREQLEAEIKRLKIHSDIIKENLLSGTDQHLAPLGKAIGVMKDKIRMAKLNTAVDASLPVDLEDCIITNGRATLDEEKLKERFALRIENEQQEAFYRHYLNLCEAWNPYIDFLRSTGYNTHRDMVFGPDGFICEGGEGQLLINHQTLNYFR